MCSVTCGGGETQRARNCDNPPATHGGLQCQGESQQTDECGGKTCPGLEHFKRTASEDLSLLNKYFMYSTNKQAIILYWYNPLQVAPIQPHLLLWKCLTLMSWQRRLYAHSQIAFSSVTPISQPVRLYYTLVVFPTNQASQLLNCVLFRSVTSCTFN